MNVRKWDDFFHFYTSRYGKKHCSKAGKEYYLPPYSHECQYVTIIPFSSYRGDVDIFLLDLHDKLKCHWIVI